MFGETAITNLSSLRASAYERLASYLKTAFDVTITSDRLEGMLGFLVTSPFSATRALCLADDATVTERTYVLLHVASHLLLGHAARPFATFLEPRVGAIKQVFGIDRKRLDEHRQADLLARAILLGCEDRSWSRFLEALEGDPNRAYDRFLRSQALEISNRLPSHRHRLFWRLLSLNVTRQTVIVSLKCARAAYHLSQLRHLDAVKTAVSPVRELYWRTEVVHSALRASA